MQGLSRDFLERCPVENGLYRHAIAKSEPLLMNDHEQYLSQTSAFVWAGSAGVCLSSIALALALSDELVPFAGFAFGLLGIWVPWAHNYRLQKQPAGG